MKELESLIKSINQAKKNTRRIVKSSTPRPQKKMQYIKKSGDGGLIMDFGGASDLHPSFKAYERILNLHGDPTQAQTAQYQSNSFEKALDSYVELGEDAYNRKVSIEEKNSLIRAQESQRIAKSKFANTTMTVGREKITAQSETDAAIMEMFKNNELE